MNFLIERKEHILLLSVTLPQHVDFHLYFFAFNYDHFSPNIVLNSLLFSSLVHNIKKTFLRQFQLPFLTLQILLSLFSLPSWISASKAHLYPSVKFTSPETLALARLSLSSSFNIGFPTVFCAYLSWQIYDVPPRTPFR